MADTSVGADTLAALADAGSSDQLIEVTAPSATGLTGMRDALLDRPGADAVVPDLLVAGIEDQIGHSARRVGVRRTRSLVSVSSSKQQNGVTTFAPSARGRLRQAASEREESPLGQPGWNAAPDHARRFARPGVPARRRWPIPFRQRHGQAPARLRQGSAARRALLATGLRGRGGGRVGQNQQLHSLAQRDAAVTGLPRRGRRASGVRRPSSSPGWRKQLRAGLVGLRAAALFGTFFVGRGGGAHGAVRAVGVVGGSRGAGADREPVVSVGRGACGGGGRRGPASGGGSADAGRGRGGGVRDGGAGVGRRVVGSGGDGSRGRGLASGAFDGSGHRGARVRAVGGFCDGAARRGAGDGGGRAAALQPRRRRAAERAAAGERPRRARGGERAGRGRCGPGGRSGDGGSGAVGGARLRGGGAGERIGCGTFGIAR